MIWYIQGTEAQRDLITSANAACSFPFERLLPSLRRENKSEIHVSFRDLSRHSEAIAEAAEGSHHVHDGDYDAHPIVRPIAGRSRVLGLFYLPPRTAIVLDQSLIEHPALAREVFLAEAAHAVDYHYMTADMRREFWNVVHPDHQDVGVGTTVHDSGDVDHGHSWFDGTAGYDTWVGEAWMQGFVNTFAPGVEYTMPLGHACPPDAIPHLRSVILHEPKFDDYEPRASFLTRLRDLVRRVIQWLSS